MRRPEHLRANLSYVKQGPLQPHCWLISNSIAGTAATRDARGHAARRDGSLRTVADAHAHEDDTDVRLHRSFGDAEIEGNLAIASAPDDELQDFALARLRSESGVRVSRILATGAGR